MGNLGNWTLCIRDRSREIESVRLTKYKKKDKKDVLIYNQEIKNGFKRFDKIINKYSKWMLKKKVH